jgi:hypothetical protein
MSKGWSEFVGGNVVDESVSMEVMTTHSLGCSLVDSVPVHGLTDCTANAQTEPNCRALTMPSPRAAPFKGIS